MATYRCAACGAVNGLSGPVYGECACARCRRTLDLSGSPQPVDAAALVAAIRSCPAPVLVHFSEQGLASPELETQARALAGELLVLQVDPRVEPAAAEAYRVGGAPTLVLFERGTEVARRDGQAWPSLAAAVAAPHPAAR